MWIKRVFTALISLSAAAALAETVGYAQATNYFKKDSRPTLYQPLNLLDARDATAWCSPATDPLNEILSFGFNEPIKLEELRINSGNNFDEGTWNDFARARKLVIKSGKQSQKVTLEDLRGPQTVHLSPAMVGSRFTVEVLDLFPAEDPDAPLCLTDVVFLVDGKPINGPWLTTRLKYDKGAAAVMGTWYAGYPGTPDRFLSFNFDGSFRYSYEPFDTGRNQPKSLTGSYDASTGRIVFGTGGKRYGVKLSKDAAKKGFTLTFEGDLPEDLKGPWRSEP